MYDLFIENRKKKQLKSNLVRIINFQANTINQTDIYLKKNCATIR